MSIEYIRSENAESKIISQYYMKSKNFQMWPEFFFYYRAESKMLAIFKSQAAAKFSFSTETTQIYLPDCFNRTDINMTEF